jgi:hypothetical protein
MATLDLTTQLKAIQDAVVVQSGIADGRVMWTDGNAAQTAYPYVSLSALLEIDQHDRPHVKYTFDAVDDELDLELGQHQLLDVSINVFANANAPTTHARYFADLIRTGLRKPSTLSALRAASLGFVRVSDTRDLSEMIKSKRRTRAQFDATFSLSRVYSDVSIPYIKTIDYELDLGLGGSPDDSGTLTLP